MKKRIQVMVEDELYNHIENKAKESGLSLSSYIRTKLIEIPSYVNGGKVDIGSTHSIKEEGGIMTIAFNDKK